VPYSSDHDPFQLQRFVDAQRAVYQQALAELRAGRKQGHWIWFILPQLCGLGRSQLAQRYAISCRAEAAAYLEHPLLGARLRECVAAITAIDGSSIEHILGQPDDLKFRSCLTLFGAVADDPALFDHALGKFYAGQRDSLTLRLLGHRDAVAREDNSPSGIP
jgi:uncharacterized protein (DUF1810 family)